MNETEWQRYLELEALRDECRLLEAETSIERARAEDAWMDLWFMEDPRRWERYFGSDRREFLEGTAGGGCAVELAAYGWRRDYGEWPSFFNLTDRLSVETGVSYRAARLRIEREVNDPSSDHHLHIIRAERLAEILNDEPHKCGQWVRYEEHVRFYVDAAGQADLEGRHEVVSRMAAA